MPLHKKVIAIIGATGQQGGGLARAILCEGDSSEFEVRIVTRNVNSEKAIEFSRLGADVVVGDINDEASLTNAIEGVYGMFCVTLSAWNEYVPEMEIAQAANMSNAARNAGIKHVVWSTMEDTRLVCPLSNPRLPTLCGRYKVPFFDAKGESDKFFADLPTTYLLPGIYWDILTELAPPEKYNGEYYLALPIGKKVMPGIGTEDIGRCALGAFKQPEKYINKRVGIVGEKLTLAQMSAKLSSALGVTIHPYEMSFDEMRQLPFRNSEYFANMYQYLHDFETEANSIRSFEESRQLNPHMMDFDKWLIINKHRIPLNT